MWDLTCASAGEGMQTRRKRKMPNPPKDGFAVANAQRFNVQRSTAEECASVTHGLVGDQ